MPTRQVKINLYSQVMPQLVKNYSATLPSSISHLKIARVNVMENLDHYYSVKVSTLKHKAPSSWPKHVMKVHKENI